MSGSSIVVDSDIGVTKAELVNKDPAGSFTGEIGIAKAELGNNEAAGGKGVVTEASWSDFVFLTKPPAGIELERNKADEPTVAMITKERVPDSFIDRIKTCPSRKLSPLTEDDIEFYTENSPDNPEFVASELANIARWNYFVDLEQDCLRQYAENGYAEVGVDFTNGIKQLFILPQPQVTTTTTTTMQLGNGGGGRLSSKTTTLIFSGFAMVIFALVGLVLSCLLSRVSVQV